MYYAFLDVPGHGGCAVVRFKLTPASLGKDISVEDEGVFDDAVEERRQEADEFYNSFVFGPISDDLKATMRQAFGGMPWTKQSIGFFRKNGLRATQLNLRLHQNGSISGIGCDSFFLAFF